MITVLTGTNSLAVREASQAIVQAFIAEHGDMAVERLDGEEAAYDRMREAVESMPFLASKKLVVLRNPSANKEFLEKASELLADISETTDVVIVESKLDKRTAYYKFLKKHAQYKELNELDENGLARWLAEQATEAKGSLSLADARYLVQRVGANQQLLSNELAKLLNYDPKITRKTIDLLTDQTPQGTIFELLEAALSGNTRKALGLYQEQRAMKVEPQQIIAMLAWQLHVLAVVATAEGRDAGSIAREAKLNPYVVGKSQTLAQRLGRAQIRQLVRRTLELDIRSKREPIDVDEALQHLLIHMSPTVSV